jgi:hypothetical protein
MRLPAAGRGRPAAPAGGRADQLRLIHLAQVEEQLRPGVQADRHAVEDRRDVLAHASPVRARAVEGQLARLGEQSVARVSEDGQHVVGQLAAQQPTSEPMRPVQRVTIRRSPTDRYGG